MQLPDNVIFGAFASLILVLNYVSIDLGRPSLFIGQNDSFIFTSILFIVYGLYLFGKTKIFKLAPNVSWSYSNIIISVCLPSFFGLVSEPMQISSAFSAIFPIIVFHYATQGFTSSFHSQWILAIAMCNIIALSWFAIIPIRVDLESGFVGIVRCMVLASILNLGYKLDSSSCLIAGLSGLNLGLLKSNFTNYNLRPFIFSMPAIKSLLELVFVTQLINVPFYLSWIPLVPMSFNTFVNSIQIQRIMMPTIMQNFCFLVPLVTLIMRLRLKLHRHDSHKLNILTICGVIAFILGFSFVQIFPGEITHPYKDLFIIANTRSRMIEENAPESYSECVDAYTKRYNRDPPPGFEAWYNYAKEHNSLIFINYDSIDELLNPFREFKSDDLNYALDLAVSMDPTGGNVGFEIKNGKLSTFSGIKYDTHRWMQEFIEDMIRKFSNNIPDLRFVVNIHDECRVLPSEPFSLPERREWKNDELFKNYGHQNLRQEAQKACSINSHLRVHQNLPEQLHDWVSKNVSEFYEEALTDPNWITNICERPEIMEYAAYWQFPNLASLSSKLLPIFSQSRAPPTRDILFPAPFEYGEKVKYESEHDIPWEEKRNAVYWRGASTGGFIKDNTWHLMSRPLLAYLSKYPQAYFMTFFEKVSPLFSSMPSTQFTKRWSNLKDILRKASVELDVGITQYSFGDSASTWRLSKIIGTAPPIGFSENFKNKYIIDLDGQAFSGRFIPFLKSQSLVLKSTVWETWYSSRLVPWAHYVPVDQSYKDLGDIIYFLSMNDDIALQIARDGADWANKVLRKEDMEIFFFRLLLEYNRLFVNEAK